MTFYLAPDAYTMLRPEGSRFHPRVIRHWLRWYLRMPWIPIQIHLPRPRRVIIAGSRAIIEYEEPAQTDEEMEGFTV